MNDLISRKDAIEAIMYGNSIDIVDRTKLEQRIKELPTIEAEPVVHGEWEEEIMNYFCSQCKTAFCDDLAWITGELKLPNFCPECGADMRKKVE